MSIRINNKIISGTYTAQSYRYVGEIFQSALPIEDIRVALLDGHKIYESEGYGSFIQYITSLALLYPQLSCTEDEWQLSDTTYGECGKFVISEDGVRLPKIVSFVQGLSSLQDLATLVEAGLPNITGKTGYNFQEERASGAFSSSNVTQSNAIFANTANNTAQFFDASRSNPTYGNSTTVQPQSIRYPYYIVLATGVTQEVKVKEELSTNNPFTLFESKYSEVELNNTSWLLSSGQWNSKELYPSAYNELLKEYNTPNRLHNVVLHSDTYIDYDFVLNLENETFRLPKLTKTRVLVAKKEPTTADPTWYNLYSDGWLEQGGHISYVTVDWMRVQFLKPFKDINYNFNRCNYTNVASVATNFANEGHVDKTVDGVSIYNHLGYCTAFSWDACGYTEIPTENNYLYFYVGDTNINVSLVDTGKLTQEVANLIPNNSSLISGYSMPSDRYVDLELGASGTTYTAPANGYYLLSKYATAQAHNIAMKKFGEIWVLEWAPVAQVNLFCWVPVKKGETITVTYNATGTTNYFKFYYAQGEI